MVFPVHFHTNLKVQKEVLPDATWLLSDEAKISIHVSKLRLPLRQWCHITVDQNDPELVEMQVPWAHTPSNSDLIAGWRMCS